MRCSKRVRIPQQEQVSRPASGGQPQRGDRALLMRPRSCCSTNRPRRSIRDGDGSARPPIELAPRGMTALGGGGGGGEPTRWASPSAVAGPRDLMERGRKSSAGRSWGSSPTEERAHQAFSARSCYHRPWRAAPGRAGPEDRQSSCVPGGAGFIGSAVVASRDPRPDWRRQRASGRRRHLESLATGRATAIGPPLQGRHLSTAAPPTRYSARSSPTCHSWRPKAVDPLVPARPLSRTTCRQPLIAARNRRSPPGAASTPLGGGFRFKHILPRRGVGSLTGRQVHRNHGLRTNCPLRSKECPIHGSGGYAVGMQSLVRHTFSSRPATRHPPTAFVFWFFGGGVWGGSEQVRAYSFPAS